MASRAHAVIYVPGLGDSRVRGQRLALKLWRIQGVEPYLFQMQWARGEDFTTTFNRLLRLVDRLHGQGKAVSLVGASAGASVAVQAMAARPKAVTAVGCICGKIRNAHTVSDYTYRANPAFRTSMDLLPAALESLSLTQRKAIISFRPLADESVPPADTYIDGATIGKIPVAGHFTAIAYGLTIGSRQLLRFLKAANR